MARYLEKGHIIFMRGSSLMAVPFDLATLTMKDSPELILEGVRNENGANSSQCLAQEHSSMYRGRIRAPVHSGG